MNGIFRHTFGLGILLTLLISTAYGQSVPGQQLALQLNPGENNPRNSEGDFVTLNDGQILFVYSHYTGQSTDDHAPAYLAGRYSSDGGKTWTKDDKLILEQEGDMNSMSISLLRLQDGRIALFYLRKNSLEDCIPLMRTSTDEAKTWSEPVACITDQLGYYVLNNNRVIQLKNGRLMFAVARHKTPSDSVWRSSGKLFSYYSDDNGQTWQAGAEVPNPDGLVTQEPGLIELKNGRIMMFVRASGGVQQLSYSKDKGQTWTPLEPSTIASPLSPASIARIPKTGDLLLVWNNNSVRDKSWHGGNRTPLTIAVSKDEGKTWQHVKNIETDPDGWFCYTAIHFDKKHVVLGYCAGNRPKKTHLSVINITRIPVKSLY